MTTLALNTPRDFEIGQRNDLPMATATTIFEGAAVGMTSGYARPLNAADQFVGFAKEKVVNAGANGAARIRVQDSGKVVLPISGAAITDIGKAVYASDDNAFTFTATSNSYIGRVVRFVSTGVVVVAFDARVATLAGLTDSSGGTASATTVVAIGSAFSQSEIANNFATLTARLNALTQLQK